MRNVRMGSQTKLVPTAEGYGLDALETVKTSTVRPPGTMSCRETCGRTSMPW